MEMSDKDRPTSDATEREPAGAPVGHGGVRVEIAEKPAWSIGGGAGLTILVVLLAVAIWMFALSDSGGPVGVFVTVGIVATLVFSVLATSLTVVSPGDTKVQQFFGGYVGTLRRSGLQLTMPLVVRRRVSVKVRNFETNELKVNDADGNPVNIAAIIVWQVADTAKAVFAVDEFSDFVRVQSESALRHVTSTHPYDNAAPGEESLRGSTEVVAAELAQEVAARIAIAGLEVVEARISSLAYAPEIAHAMLQRQQASAVIAAREQIVDGAVGMVQGALRQLEAGDVVEMDDERKAAMVSNLMVVLCSSSAPTPVVNTGSLYT